MAMKIRKRLFIAKEEVCASREFSGIPGSLTYGIVSSTSVRTGYGNTFPRAGRRE
jgi:hypothetical protein